MTRDANDVHREQGDAGVRGMHDRRLHGRSRLPIRLRFCGRSALAQRISSLAATLPITDLTTEELKGKIVRLEREIEIKQRALSISARRVVEIHAELEAISTVKARHRQ